MVFEQVVLPSKNHTLAIAILYVRILYACCCKVKTYQKEHIRSNTYIHAHLNVMF